MLMVIESTSNASVRFGNHAYGRRASNHKPDPGAARFQNRQSTICGLPSLDMDSTAINSTGSRGGTIERVCEQESPACVTTWVYLCTSQHDTKQAVVESRVVPCLIDRVLSL
jgi:hypothetical protein